MAIMNTEKKSGTAHAIFGTGAGHLISAGICGGADAATLIVYDNTSAAGTVICKLGVGIGLSATFTPAVPIAFGTGLYFELTGTTPVIFGAWIGPKAA